MSHLPNDPDDDISRHAWQPCPNCHHGHECRQCRNNQNCQIHRQHLLNSKGSRVSLQCPRCAHVWMDDVIAGELVAGHRSQEEAQAVGATISLGGRAGQVASSPDGNCVYVLVADAVKVINRSHHIVATYRTGPDPKNIIVSADGTRLYVTGYDGCTSIISTADNTVKTFVLERLSTAEVVSADGNYIYMAHSGTTGGTQSNRISIIGADGTRVAVVPVDGHTTGLGASPDGSHLYVSARRSLSSLDWRGLITVIDTDTHRIVDKIAVELAPDTVTVSPDGAHLYATHYHNNAVSIMDLHIGGGVSHHHGLHRAE